jgi:carbonic anhydrase
LQYACVQHKQEIAEKTSHAYGNKIRDANAAIQELKNGNIRFFNESCININYKEQIEISHAQQKPFAVILSCMDSRVPPEIIFDQGIGHLFVIRNAGNLEDENVLGSIEYAVKFVDVKLVVVMGHSHCGAAKGAVKDIKHEHLTQLLEQIKPSVTANYKQSTNNHGLSRHETEFDEVVEETTLQHINSTIVDIENKSATVASFKQQNKIKIIGAFYNVETGIVSFIN